MLEKELAKLDFTPNVSKVYLYVLSQKESVRAGEVIQTTGLPRSVVYTSLNELVDRGLVAQAKNRGVLVYRANNPESLIEENRDRLKLAKMVAQQLDQIHELHERQVEVHEGDNIVKQVALESLKIDRGQTVYFLGSSKYGSQGNLEKFWASYHRRRIKAGLSCKILYDRDVDPKILAKRNQLDGCQARYMPFGYHLPVWFSIYESKVAIVVPSEDPPFSFMIRSHKTAEAMLNYFNYLWNQGDLN